MFCFQLSFPNGTFYAVVEWKVGMLVETTVFVEAGCEVEKKKINLLVNENLNK